MQAMQEPRALQLCTTTGYPHRRTRRPHRLTLNTFPRFSAGPNAILSSMRSNNSTALQHASNGTQHLPASPHIQSPLLESGRLSAPRPCPVARGGGTPPSRPCALARVHSGTARSTCHRHGAAHTSVRLVRPPPHLALPKLVHQPPVHAAKQRGRPSAHRRLS